MWFKLAGATFTNNLGTMDSISKSYMMDYSGLTGLSASPGSVSYASDSTPDATITFTVKSGYVFKSGSKITASGGASKTYTASADIAAGSSFTMALTGINNKVTFTGAAELVSGGSGGGDTSTNYIFTLNPTPTSAAVTLSATGYTTVTGTGSKSITVANGTKVNWSVSASGYTTRTGDWTINGGNKTENITLTASGGDTAVGSELEEIETTEGYYINIGLQNVENSAFNIGKYDVSTAGKIKASCRQGLSSVVAFTNAQGVRTSAGSGNTDSGVNFVKELEVPYDAVYFELTYAIAQPHSVIKLAEKDNADIDSFTAIEPESTTPGYYINSELSNTAMSVFTIGKYNVSNYSKVYVEARIGAVAHLAWVDNSGKRTLAGVGNNGTGVNYKNILTVPETAVYLEFGYSTSQPCTVRGGE